jgi:hypothetical protein
MRTGKDENRKGWKDRELVKEGDRILYPHNDWRKKV